jgi:hypothetical protein
VRIHLIEKTFPACRATIRIGISLRHLKTETFPMSETSCFLGIENTGRLTESSSIILSVINRRHNSLNSASVAVFFK